MCSQAHSTEQWQFVSRHCRVSVYSRAEDFLLFEDLKSSDESCCVCMTDFYWADCFFFVYQYCSWVGEMCIGISVLYCPVYSEWVCCQESGEGRGGGGPLGSLTREYVGFLIDVLRDGSLLWWFHLLHWMSHFFFTFLSPWVLLIRLQKTVWQIGKHVEGGTGVLALRLVLDVESSRWSCWHLSEEWEHLLWPVVPLLPFHPSWHVPCPCVWTQCNQIPQCIPLNLLH